MSGANGTSTETHQRLQDRLPEDPYQQFPITDASRPEDYIRDVLNLTVRVKIPFESAYEKWSTTGLLTRHYSHPWLAARRAAVEALATVKTGQFQGGYVTNHVTKALPEAVAVG